MHIIYKKTSKMNYKHQIYAIVITLVKQFFFNFFFLIIIIFTFKQGE